MASYKQQLKIVRQYTGDAFKAARGYDMRNAPNFGKKMAVLKYYRKVQSLMSSETVVYTPKRGEKAEAFNYTGQTGFRKFVKAIVRKISPDQDLSFEIDKTMPRGHRFTAVDNNTGRRYWNLPARLFMDDTLDWQQFSKIIKEYAPEAEFFLIQAGETYMWGAGGGPDAIAQKLAEVFRNYSAKQFDAHDKNSSYYGNWFGGISGFTSRFDVMPRIATALQNRRNYREKYRMHPTRSYRRLNNDMMGVFENGTLISIHPVTWERK